VANGDDLDAREGMALGATVAGLAFSNVGVAAVHALQAPLGGAIHNSHGEGNGLLLPYVMRFNLPARRKEFATIARLLGEDVTGLDEQAAAERAVAAVERLQKDIGIPQRLRDIRVSEALLRPLAEKAFNVRRAMRVNPRLATVEDLEGILRAAF
jgi:alcohol dehydrogenase class IV